MLVPPSLWDLPESSKRIQIILRVLQVLPFDKKATDIVLKYFEHDSFDR